MESLTQRRSDAAGSIFEACSLPRFEKADIPQNIVIGDRNLELEGVGCSRRDQITIARTYLPFPRTPAAAR